MSYWFERAELSWSKVMSHPSVHDVQDLATFESEFDDSWWVVNYI